MNFVSFGDSALRFENEHLPNQTAYQPWKSPNGF